MYPPNLKHQIKQRVFKKNILINTISKLKLIDTCNYSQGFNGIEFEEHQIRLKILATELETAQILKQKAQMELTFLSNEHQLRMQLLSAQLGNTSQSILP